MPIEKVMEALNGYEAKAAADIRLDHEIGADPYESVGRHILIRKIKKLIVSELKVNIQEVT